MTKEEQIFCLNHSTVAAFDFCNICDDPFCEKCYLISKGRCLCHSHFKIFKDSRWVETLRSNSSPQNPQNGIVLYEFKKEIYRSFEIPTFLDIYYSDTSHGIESTNILYSREEDRSFIMNKFKEGHKDPL